MARLSIGGRAILHDDLRRQLFELNDTADLIWEALASGAGEAQAVRGLQARGVEPSEAQTFVREAASGWMSAGHIAPRSALRALSQPPDEVRRLALKELSLEVTFHGLSAAACDLVASPFYTETPARDRLAVVAYDELFLFFLNGEIRCGCPAERLAPQFKATLTELYLAAIDDAYLVHGAMLFRHGASLFIGGEPGAGKSTLALALAAAGWGFGGDDIVRVEPDGRASPVTFAACAKPGSWPLLEPLWPGLAEARTWLRSDGQSVRYLVPTALVPPTPCGFGGVVLLSREPGASAALLPISPLEALKSLLESAHSGQWSFTGNALRGLATRLEGAPCRRLVYSELGPAVAALEGLRLASP